MNYFPNAKVTLLSAALGACMATPVVTTAETTDPYLKPDGSWISISGTVKSVSPNVFTLDYGDFVISVEMDDGDRDADAYKLMTGDKVTVTGVVDDDLFETTTIEASSVYVEKLGTHFYASAVDEEDTAFVIATPVILNSVTMKGDVTTIAGEEFMIDTGTRTVTVDVSNMAYDPLDDEGYQRVESGDTVIVGGYIDNGFFTGPELVAEYVISSNETIPKDKKSMKGENKSKKTSSTEKSTSGGEASGKS